MRRLGCFVVIAVLAAGCATPAANHPTANDRTDVWFTQHMVPYLRQTTTVVSLTRPYLTDPTLARLADKVNRTSQADIQQLQGWLDQRGLSPHIHSHQRIDTRRQTDLERLSQLRGSALDLAFVRVMTARARAGINLTATEVSDGGLPEVRQLAHQMLAEQQAQSRQFKHWSHTAKARTSHPPAKTPAPRPTADSIWRPPVVAALLDHPQMPPAATLRPQGMIIEASKASSREEAWVL